MLEREHEYIRDRLEYPAESKDTDYKSAIEFKEKNDFSAKLVKHILGFANSGGGLLIIGYNESEDGSFIAEANIAEEVKEVKYPVISIYRFPEYLFLKISPLIISQSSLS